MALYQLGIYEKAFPPSYSWQEKFMVSKKLGFDYIEISIDETDEKLSRLDMSYEKRQELFLLSKKEKMPISTLCLSAHRKYPLGSNIAAIEAKSLEIIEKAINFAVDLGIRIIQLAGYDVYYEEGSERTKKRFRNNLELAVRMAAAKGVMLGFETMETSFMNTVAKAMIYVTDIHSPWLQIYPDLGNLTNAAHGIWEKVAEDIKTGANALVAMHLKETKPGVFREMDFGTGYVNFEAGITTAWKYGVRRFTLECWYTDDISWFEKLADAKNFFATLLDGQ